MEDQKVERRVPWWVWAASAVVVLLWIAVAVCGYLLLRVSNGQAAITNAGQFGDFFGAVNALFSGFAFIGLIYTIHMQRQELALQRQELKAQREEMAGSRQQLEAQVEAQYALIRVTITQVDVAGMQTVAEGLRMEAEAASDVANRQKTGRRVAELGNSIRTKAQDLLSQLPNK